MRTVQVRIAVAMDADGNWFAIGWDTAESGKVSRAAVLNLGSGGDMAEVRWVRADVPMPDEPVRAALDSREEATT